MSDSLDRLLNLTANIVSAHVRHNASQAKALPELIESIYSTLRNLETGSAVAETGPLVPAVSIKKSVFDDYIVCLEDGRKLKMLKRHLRASFGMTPDDYRKRWGLPASYPMVAPAYAKYRSGIAAKIGLGRQPEARAEMKAAAYPEPTITQVPEGRRGRKKTAAA